MIATSDRPERHQQLRPQRRLLRELSAQDIWDAKSDYYQDTEYDMSTGPAAGPWVNTCVQEIANLKANRQPRMSMPKTMIPHLQEEAAELSKTDVKAAISLIDQFAYANAVALHEEWILLGY